MNSWKVVQKKKKMRIEIKLILLLLQLTLLQSCSYGGPAQDAGESIHGPEQSNNDAPLSAYQFVYSFKNTVSLTKKAAMSFLVNTIMLTTLAMDLPW